LWPVARHFVRENCLAADEAGLSLAQKVLVEHHKTCHCHCSVCS